MTCGPRGSMQNSTHSNTKNIGGEDRRVHPQIWLFHQIYPQIWEIYKERIGVTLTQLLKQLWHTYLSKTHIRFVLQEQVCQILRRFSLCAVWILKQLTTLVDNKASEALLTISAIQSGAEWCSDRNARENCKSSFVITELSVSPTVNT